MESEPMITVAPQRWLQHPWARMAPAACALAPVDALAAIAHPNPEPMTDWGTGPRVDRVEVIWQNILEQGMADPLVVVWGVPRDPSLPHTLRLESGNHRIHTARTTGCTHLPVVAMAMEGGIFHPGNGTHTTPVPRASYDAWMATMGRSADRFEPYPHPIPLADLWPEAVLPLPGPIVPLSRVVWGREVARGMVAFHVV